ncbi:class I SAM-dependent methyltransferase [Sphingomonas sp. MMS24-J13]|uniref:class I SAM-dependent methyltransferase n=1 Tax=Sphingomonas sp. MMS24-J13 TaxID=3238686 RepID=UPI00384A704D
MIRSTIAAATIGLLLACTAPAATPSPAIAAAIADPARPASDKARDDERKPAEMLAFAGIKPGMVVLEMMPGGGYFTRLFSDMVGPKGKVMAYVPDEFLTKSTRAIDGVTALSKESGRENITVEHDPLMQPGPDNLIDVAWTSQNYHDFHNLPGIDMVAANKVLFRMIRPGGTYIVLDHSAPAGSGAANTQDLHRIDAALVRQEVEAAGFVFDGESKVLANPADTRTVKIFDPSIRGHTDQFVLRFRKPGKAG